MRKTTWIAALAVLTVTAANAQSDNKVVVTGSIQSDILIPQDDEKIGTEHTSDWALTNSYADVSLQSKYIDAGARFEFL